MLFPAKDFRDIVTKKFPSLINARQKNRAMDSKLGGNFLLVFPDTFWDLEVVLNNLAVMPYLAPKDLSLDSIMPLLNMLEGIVSAGYRDLRFRPTAIKPKIFIYFPKPVSFLGTERPVRNTVTGVVFNYTVYEYQVRIYYNDDLVPRFEYGPKVKIQQTPVMTTPPVVLAPSKPAVPAPVPTPVPTTTTTTVDFGPSPFGFDTSSITSSFGSIAKSKAAEPQSEGFKMPSTGTSSTSDDKINWFSASTPDTGFKFAM